MAAKGENPSVCDGLCIRKRERNARSQPAQKCITVGGKREFQGEGLGGPGIGHANYFNSERETGIMTSTSDVPMGEGSGGVEGEGIKCITLAEDCLAWDWVDIPPRCYA